MIGRLLFLSVFGVFLTLGLHIALLLILPFSEPDRIWQRISVLGDDNAFHPIADLPSRDPLMFEGVCRFRLSEQPVLVSLEPTNAYWAISVFDQTSTLYFTMSDSSAPNGRPELVVANEEQDANLQSDENQLILRAAPGAYFATFKTFAATPEATETAEAVLRRAICSEVALEPVDLYEPRLRPGDLPTPLPKPSVPRS